MTALSRSLLAFSLSALASTALGAVPQPLPMIRGVVVDPTGAPLPGAVVSLDVPGITTVTAVDGRFAITPGTPGRRRVRITLVDTSRQKPRSCCRRRPVGAHPRSCASPSCPYPGRRLRSSPRLAAITAGAPSSASASTTASAATSTPAAIGTHQQPGGGHHEEPLRGRVRHGPPLALRRRLHAPRVDRGACDVHVPVARRRPDADGRHRVVEPVRRSTTTTRASASTWGSGATPRSRIASALYGEGTIGLAFIGETDVMLVAPASQPRGRRHRLLRPDGRVHGRGQRGRAV